MAACRGIGRLRVHPRSEFVWIRSYFVECPPSRWRIRHCDRHEAGPRTVRYRDRRGWIEPSGRGCSGADAL